LSISNTNTPVELPIIKQHVIWNSLQWPTSTVMWRTVCNGQHPQLCEGQFAMANIHSYVKDGQP